MKTTDKDLQKQLPEFLFRNMPLEIPSSGFSEKLSIRIEKEIRKKERKRTLITAGQIAAGVLSIILSTAGVLYWQSNFTFSFFKNNLSFDPLIWVIGLAVLLVLMGESLLRKHIH